jgi:predicted Zn-dependent protease
VIACATSPLGRKQFIAVPDSQMNEMGVQSFQQLKGSEPIEKDPTTNQYVQCLVDPLLQAAQGQTEEKSWEVVVFKNKEANAFALPGGKIGVYTGIIQVGKNDSQLAAVIGHEIGHVIAKHGAERVSQQMGTQLGLSALGTTVNPNVMGLLGLGAQVGILLPFSRTQESEADLIGLDLMARAGFDPRQSTELWKNMIAKSGGNSPPKWLSTHPASEDRIAELEKNMPGAMLKYDQAKAAGKVPHCKRPPGY